MAEKNNECDDCINIDITQGISNAGGLWCNKKWDWVFNVCDEFKERKNNES